LARRRSQFIQERAAEPTADRLPVAGRGIFDGERRGQRVADDLEAPADHQLWGQWSSAIAIPDGQRVDLRW
jgi:hypothetical protein